MQTYGFRAFIVFLPLFPQMFGVRPDLCIQIVDVLESISSDQEIIFQANPGRKKNRWEGKRNVTSGLASLCSPVREWVSAMLLLQHLEACPQTSPLGMGWDWRQSSLNFHSQGHTRPDPYPSCMPSVTAMQVPLSAPPPTKRTPCSTLFARTV